jgi:hypothetical protein
MRSWGGATEAPSLALRVIGGGQVGGQCPDSALLTALGLWRGKRETGFQTGASLSSVLTSCPHTCTSARPAAAQALLLLSEIAHCKGSFQTS